MRTRKLSLALLLICSLVLFNEAACRRCKKTTNAAGTACTATPGSDSDTTPQDTPKLLNVLANDTVSQNGTTAAATAIASVTSPTAQGGTAVISGTQILYTPPPVPGGPVTGTVVKNISTGIDDATGNKLAHCSGDSDYIIAAGGTGGSIGEVPAVARDPIPFGMADAASAASTWIALPDGCPNLFGAPNGTFFFQTQVNAAGFDPATMQIVGLRAAVDDQIDSISVNGVVVFTGPTPAPSPDFVSFGNVGLGAFHAGINTITFVVDNTPANPTPMGLRVEGTVQANTTPGPTAPFTDTFTYTISDPCGTASAPASVSVAVTAPIGAAVSVVNNSTAQITVSVGGAQVDVVQPLGMTIAPQNVASGANQQIRVDAISAAPQSNVSTSITASLTPAGAYTITYTDTGNGSPTIGVTP